MAEGNGKSIAEMLWKGLSALLTALLIAAYTWIWNAEKRISANEQVGKDVADIRTKVEVFSERFNEFLLKQARREGEEQARRELGRP